MDQQSDRNRNTMNKTKEEKQQQTLERIIQGDNPTCIHILGQPLADFLCDIIRDQQSQIDELTTRAKLTALQLDKVLSDIGRGALKVDLEINQPQ